MGEYINKKVGMNENDKGSLKNLVNEKFKKIDNKNGITRDDKEILQAGRLVVNDLIKQIKKDESMVYGKWALEPLMTLIGKKNGKGEYTSGLIFESNKLKGYKPITNNKDKINKVANLIDNAENETLKRLAKNRTIQDSRNIVRQSNETNKNKPMFVMEGGNDYRKQTGNIIFTEAANPVRIDQALKGLFTNPNVVYEIDYSGCDTSTPKGKAIKEKMTKLIGTKTCYLGYDSNLKTYVIRDPAEEGKIISQRAYIRKGVKLIPAGVRSWNAYVEQKNTDKNLGQETVLNGDKLGKLTLEMLKDMPSVKKDLKEGKYTTKEIVQLCQKTEIRLNTLLKKAKNLGYELEPECVTRKHFGYGHMELHLNSGSSEVDRTIWGNDGSYNKDLGERLDNLVDSNEGGYKTYLTKRVQQKRLEFERLSKTETTNLNKKGQQNLTDKEKELAESHKQQVLYGIGLLEKMIDNYRENEGDSWDNDDRDLVQIKKLIRNAKASINDSNNLDDNAIINKFINPIWGKWASIKRITKNINNGQGQIYENPAYKEQYNQLKNVFLGERTKQISAIRSLGGHGRLFDNTETSFLAEEIEQNDDLTVNNKEIKECINNIKTRLPNGIFDRNGNIIQKRKEQFDKMFTYAAKGTDALINLLVNSKMLPKNWKDEEDEVKKCVETLKNQLNQINQQSEGFTYTISAIKKKEHEEKLALEQKTNKSEEDIKRLQVLTYLENNPNDPAVKDSYEKTIQYMKYESKYGNLGNITKSCLFPALAELGGGTEGTNSDIYNDIKGYGFGNLSDENAKYWSEEIIEDIVVEVVVTAVAIALSECGAGEAIYVSFRVAKAAAKGAKGLKRVIKGAEVFSKTLGKKLATQYAGKFSVKSAKAAREISKVSHIATSTDKGIKGFNIARRVKDTYQTIKTTETFGSLAGKLAMKGTSMIIEGTTFHINSTIIHNAIEGKNLGEGLNPFGYTEGPNGEKISNFRNYAQSIAFLGVLKTIGKPIQGLTGNMAKGILREKYDVNTLAKMFRNGMSMTGEMGSMMGTDQILSLAFDQKFKPITAEDFVTMFGMVAGLRLTNKVNVKIQEYDRKSVTIEMRQGDNTFNVKIDGEGNVLKIDGKDINGNKIQNPQEILGIKAGVEGNNLRETHNGRELGTVRTNLRQLNNLHEGDIITVKHGENDVKFKKDKDGNREIVDAGNIENDRFAVGEKYIVKENFDGSGYHLETKTAGGPKISLDGKVGVKLGTHAYVHNELRYESGLSEDEQTLLAEQFDNNLNGDGIKIDGDTYTMKLEGNIYTIYKNGEEIAKGLGHEASANGKESLVLADSDTNINFLNTYNKIRTEYLIREEVSIKLSNKFYNELKSKNGITIDGINYKLKYLTSKINQTTGRKGILEYTETDIKTGKEIIKSTLQSSSFDIPTGSNGDRIKAQINKQKDKYTKDNFKSEYEAMKSKITEVTVETPIDIRELTKRGRQEIEVEYINGLDEQLLNFIERHGEKYDFSEFKESAIKAGQFIEGIYNRFKQRSTKLNVKMPKGFLKNIKSKIKDLSDKRRNQLTEHQKKLKERLDEFLEKKLLEKGNEVEINNEEINNLDNDSNLGEKREKLKTYKEKFKFLTENFHIDGLTRTEIESLTKDQINTLKELKELGFSLSLGDISIKLLKLNLLNNEINTLRQLKDLGVNIFSYTNEISKFTPEQINTLKELKDLGADLSFDVRDLSNLNTEQINTLKKLKDIGVDLSFHVRDLSNLNTEQINILKELKNLGIDISEVFPNYGRELISYKPEEIQKLQNIHKIFGGIEITKDNFGELIKLTDVQLTNLIELKNNLGIKITDLNFREYSELTDSEIDKIIVANKIGITADDIFKEGNLKRITSLSEVDINNLQNIKQELDNLKISINIVNIDLICKLNESDIINLKKIKPVLDELGIEIYGYQAKKWSNLILTKTEIDNIIKLKKICDEHKIKLENLKIENFKEIKQFTDNEIDILSIDSKNLYEGYDYSKEEIETHHRYKRGSIIENIQQYMQKTVNENRDISSREIIEAIRTNLITLPAIERFNIISGIFEATTKFNTIRKYLDFKNGPYKTPKELLCAMREIEPSKISGIKEESITAIQHGLSIQFFVGDRESYKIIDTQGKNENGYQESGGFSSSYSKIKELEKTLCVVNGKRTTDISQYEYRTVRHEGQHNRNSYFMPDKYLYEPITRAKDEITAYLRDGRGIFKVEKWDDTIKDILTEDGGLYHYEDSEGNKLEGEKWENHKKQVIELLTYADDLIELSKNPKTGLTKDKVISMLSDVPAEGWKDLHSTITEAVKIHIDKSISQSEIKGLRAKFINQIKNRCENSGLMRNLINWWNGLFPTYGIQLDEFRRAETTKIGTVVNRIKNCSSLEEIKYILKDPQYSHISRGADNKGGIEISAIIDEVIAGNKSRITFIPPEIRTKIEVLI